MAVCRWLDDGLMVSRRVLIQALLLSPVALGAQCAGLRQRELPATTARGPRTFDEARNALDPAAYPPEDPSSVGFRFSLTGSRYEITYSGTVRRTDVGGKTLEFRLDLGEKDSYSVRVYYAEVSGDIVVACESSDSESGWAFITRLDGSTMKPKWRDSIPGFNVGRGLVEGHFAYLTAFGFVAKTDLDSGTYLWRHDDLYDAFGPTGGHFNAFETPQLEGDTVLFKEESPDYSPVKTLKVDKRSGKLLGASKRRPAF